jgi:hypothetical protein
MLSGCVQDAEGTAISGATVTLYQGEEVIKTIQTGASGRFALWGVTRGTYRLEVEAWAGKQRYRETRVLSVPTARQTICFVRNTDRAG